MDIDGPSMAQKDWLRVLTSTALGGAAAITIYLRPSAVEIVILGQTLAVPGECNSVIFLIARLVVQLQFT